MNTLNVKIRLRLFFIVASVLFISLIPLECFAQDLTESESRVYRERLVAEAKKYIGAPYVRGATGPDSFDCSGLIYTIAHDSIGYQLPRTVKAIYSYVKIVPDSKREPGDLVFFRTTGDGSISHVGLYIGNGQFISAVSDGPNTGVIANSLRESYWKAHYASCGKFLRDANLVEDNEADVAKKTASTKKAGNTKAVASKTSSKSSSSSGKNSASKKASSSSSNAFGDRMFLYAMNTVDWSLFTERRFMPNFRGVSLESGFVYKMDTISPGAGLILRWNYGVSAFQIPIVGTLNVNDYVRAYAGPVFTISNECYLPDTDKEIKSSIFPGVIGMTFALPSFTNGDLKVQIVQDICYTVFNNTSNAALNALESLSAGLELCTGVRVMLPVSMFSRG